MQKYFRFALFFFAGLGWLVTIVMVTPLVSWWAREMAGPWNDPPGDVLIVLAGATQDAGVMGASSYLRSLYAVQAYHDGRFTEVVVSGGGNVGTPIAELMKQFLVCNGVPSVSVHIEPRARNTYENAQLTKPIVDRLPGRKVLLTSDYHMARASRAFRKAGVELDTRPFPDAIKRGSSFSGRWDAFVDLINETGGLMYYAVRGWI